VGALKFCWFQLNSRLATQFPRSFSIWCPRLLKWLPVNRCVFVISWSTFTVTSLRVCGVDSCTSYRFPGRFASGM
jgi:hypothetical protein